MSLTFKFGLAAVAVALPALAPRVARAEEPIRDNSFLIEEAYNQEPGVIQHIGTFTHDLAGKGWNASFTEEWPVLGMTHQLSVTLNASGTPDAEMGDVLLNYRLQLVSREHLAIAPRLSAIFPAGGGDGGLQSNVPISIELPVPVVIHLNALATVAWDGQSATGAVGGSAIWLLHPNLNLMCEALASWGSSHTAYISPGIRGAINLRRLQIVPGLAVPIGVGPSAGEHTVFGYLSFEHPIGSSAP
jgi:hypothetical protein